MNPPLVLLMFMAFAGESVRTSFDRLSLTGQNLLGGVSTESRVQMLPNTPVWRVNVHLTCYGQNLRQTYGITETSAIQGSFNIATNGGTKIPVSFAFTGQYAMQSGGPTGTYGSFGIESSPISYSYQRPNVPPVFADGTGAGALISGDRGLIGIQIPGGTSVVSISANGEVDLGDKSNALSDVGFNFPNYTHVDTSIDGKQFDIWTTFAGGSGYTYVDRCYWDMDGAEPSCEKVSVISTYCGSYYSPLMVFFDEQRPQFTGVSDVFLGQVKGEQVFWPEARSPGYFLYVKAHEGPESEMAMKMERSNKNKRIVNGAIELFGNSEENASGFVALARLDSNRNGVIDPGDRQFKLLRLWRDENANGIAEAKELSTLQSHGISKLPLNSRQVEKLYGGRAKQKDVAEFLFSKGGKVRTGQIVDMYFQTLRIGIQGMAKSGR